VLQVGQVAVALREALEHGRIEVRGGPAGKAATGQDECCPAHAGSPSSATLALRSCACRSGRGEQRRDDAEAREPDGDPQRLGEAVDERRG
jgi:hypothetical protein